MGLYHHASRSRVKGSRNVIMLIHLGSDHRGFKLKQVLRDFLEQTGYEVNGVGNIQYEKDDDYPDFAARVGEKVRLDPQSRGIVLCASGVGVDIVANKFSRVRCALVSDADQAAASRNDDDTNVLAFAADYVSEDQAKKIVSTWIQTPFSGEERHRRRIQKISDIEQQRC